MSIWTRISDALASLRKGESLSQVFDNLRTPPERSVAFAIAVIALGAKMAKADGTVTRNEVTAFREIFAIAPEDEKRAAQVFNLARQDIAGYESYARSIARMFRGSHKALEDLLEGLFHISMADGGYHPAEDAFLENVADIFRIPRPVFLNLRARHVPNAEADPFSVLGVTPGQTYEEIRARWRSLVRQNHPDRMVARGLPEEAIKLATARLTAINRAWEEITRMKGAHG
jgi:DnaJ like chaperone protein